jgi:ABC-type branched-subunit amino acid transport system substrate-binding protein
MGYAWSKRAAAFAAAALPLVAAAADDARILVGQSVALTGGLAEHGRAVTAGAKLYLDAVNASGGIAGRRIALVTLDDGGDAKRAAENTRLLIDRDAVVTMFAGIEGGPCVASLKEAAARAVPLIGCMAGSPELREPFNRYSFPVRAPHFDEFAKLLDVAKMYGFHRVAFVHSDSDTGRRHLANVQRLAAARALDVTAIVMKADATPQALAAAIRAANVQAAFNHGSYSTYSAVIRAARAGGTDMLFMAVNSGAAQMARDLGADAKGLIFTQVVPFPWSPSLPVVREYQQALARASPATEPSFSGLEGYISAKVLVAGLRAAGRDTNRERLVRQLETLGTIDLGGIVVSYGPGAHAGSTFVDSVIVARDGHFAR